MNIPNVEIVVEAGDLLYFPAFWWHEVHNEGKLNLGCGLRPRNEAGVQAFKNILAPSTTFPTGTIGKKTHSPSHFAIIATILLKGM